MRDLPQIVDRWPAEARDRFEERAAIMEFDGGLTRANAERRAEQITRAQWEEAQRAARQRVEVSDVGWR